MHEMSVKLGHAGRLVIPAKFRKELAISEGDDLVLRLSKEKLELFSRKQSVKYAQKLVRKYVPKKKSLVDELLAERREDRSL